MTGLPILTAAGMRAAEDRVIAAGTSVETLMDRAGTAAADAIWHFSGSLPVLIMCGPGNNGGDGYVIARRLAARGVKLRVAAAGQPRTEAAAAARAQWNGPVDPIDTAEPAAVLVDALFGTGLTRGLDTALSQHLARLSNASRFRIAIDLPSGCATDDGSILSAIPACDLTIALGALKPSHLLQPAARHMGRLAVADIGLGNIESTLTRMARPEIAIPAPDAHKYSRGAVAVIGGGMTGAAILAASAAQRAGAGSVALTGVADGGPAALIRKDEDAVFADQRVGAIVIGPGLGRDTRGEARLERALGAGRPLVLDADALTLLGRGVAGRLAGCGTPPILTPHAGEFERLFGTLPGSKLDQARTAAAQANAVIVFKGPDTVIAAPDGRAAIAAPAPVWLASAGTGDVLAGIAGSMLAQGLQPFEAAQAAVWLHGEAARRAGPLLIADDLVTHLSAAVAACL